MKVSRNKYFYLIEILRLLSKTFQTSLYRQCLSPTMSITKGKKPKTVFSVTSDSKASYKSVEHKKQIISTKILKIFLKNLWQH